MQAALFLLALVLGSEEPPAAVPAAAKTQATEMKPWVRLRLGPFGYPALRPEEPPTVSANIPRFETHVDVSGFGRRDPNETLKLFVQRWHLEPSIYGRGMTIQGTPGGAFNVLPLFDWGWKKWKAGRDKGPALDLGEAESPAPSAASQP